MDNILLTGLNLYYNTLSKVGQVSYKEVDYILTYRFLLKFISEYNLDIDEELRKRLKYITMLIYNSCFLDMCTGSPPKLSEKHNQYFTYIFNFNLS